MQHHVVVPAARPLYVYAMPDGLMVNGEFFQISPPIAPPKNKRGLRRGDLRVETCGELELVDLLHAQGIAFLHHVTFPVGTNKWSPDFVFTRPYLWLGEERKEFADVPILGVEVKKRQKDSIVAKNRRLLFEERGIRIKFLYHAEIRRYEKAGGLPLAPYVPGYIRPL